jgi:hypothetical protein
LELGFNYVGASFVNEPPQAGRFDCRQFTMKISGGVELRIDNILTRFIDEADLLSQIDVSKSVDKWACRIKLVLDHYLPSSVDIAPFPVLLNSAQALAKGDRLT